MIWLKPFLPSWNLTPKTDPRPGNFSAVPISPAISHSTPLKKLIGKMMNFSQRWNFPVRITSKLIKFFPQPNTKGNKGRTSQRRILLLDHFSKTTSGSPVLPSQSKHLHLFRRKESKVLKGMTKYWCTLESDREEFPTTNPSTNNSHQSVTSKYFGKFLKATKFLKKKFKLSKYQGHHRRASLCQK